jgi:hypothetical protein
MPALDRIGKKAVGNYYRDVLCCCPIATRERASVMGELEGAISPDGARNLTSQLSQLMLVLAQNQALRRNLDACPRLHSTTLTA